MVPFTILAVVVAMDRSWYTAIPIYICTVVSLLASAVLWTFGGELAHAAGAVRGADVHA